MKAYKVFTRSSSFDGINSYRSYAYLPNTIGVIYKENEWNYRHLENSKLFVFKDYNNLFEFLEKEGREFFVYDIPVNDRSISIWEVEVDELLAPPEDIILIAAYRTDDLKFEMVKFWENSISYIKRKTPTGTYCCNRVKLVKELKMIS